MEHQGPAPQGRRAAAAAAAAGPLRSSRLAARRLGRRSARAPTPLRPAPPTRPAPRPLAQVVDRFNNLFVTAFVTPGNTRFLLLHDGKSDDIIRSFFTEVYDFYLRVGQGRWAGAGFWLGGGPRGLGWGPGVMARHRPQLAGWGVGGVASRTWTRRAPPGAASGQLGRASLARRCRASAPRSAAATAAAAARRPPRR